MSESPYRYSAEPQASQLVLADAIKKATARTYYIHDRSRGYVGNSMVWWRKGHHGYTCDIREAHVFEEGELAEYLTAGDLTAYPTEYIDPLVKHHIDMQYVDRKAGITRMSSAPTTPLEK